MYPTPRVRHAGRIHPPISLLSSLYEEPKPPKTEGLHGGGHHAHHHIEHDHAHHGHNGFFARIKSLFQHDHSGEGNAGALAVEGPDDIGHIGSSAPAIVREIHRAAHGQKETFSHFLQEAGTPINTGDAASSLAFSSILTPLGLYTLGASAHEIHEAGHRRQELLQRRETLLNRSADFEGVLNRYASLGEQTRNDVSTHALLKAQDAGLDAQLAHLERELKQTKRDLRFWQSSAASGTVVSAKGIADMTTVGMVLKNAGGPTAAAAGTAGGIVSAVLGPIMGAAAVGVGGFFTANAVRNRRELAEHKSFVLAQTREDTGEMSGLTDFMERTYRKRERFDERRIHWGSVFTASSGLSLTGALVGAGAGAGIGVLLSPATMGTSIPACAIAGGVLGLVGASGALTSVWILPYGHLKNARYRRYAKRGSNEESTLLGVGNLLEPGSGSQFNNRRLYETRQKYDLLQSFLTGAAERVGKTYVVRTHESDPPEDGVQAIGVVERVKRCLRRENVGQNDLRRRMQEPEEFSSLCGFMKNVVDVETEQDNYLESKNTLRERIFNVRIPSDSETKELIIPPGFRDDARNDLDRLKRLHELSGELGVLEQGPQNEEPGVFQSNVENAMRSFLSLQGSASEDRNVYRAFARYCLKDAVKKDRDARGEIFASQQWITRVKRQAEPEPPPPANEDFVFKSAFHKAPVLETPNPLSPNPRLVYRPYKEWVSVLPRPHSAMRVTGTSAEITHDISPLTQRPTRTTDPLSQKGQQDFQQPIQAPLKSHTRGSKAQREPVPELPVEEVNIGKDKHRGNETERDGIHTIIDSEIRAQMANLQSLSNRSVTYQQTPYRSEGTSNIQRREEMIKNIRRQRDDHQFFGSGILR